MFSMKYIGMFIELYSCVVPMQQSSMLGKNLLKNMRRTTSNHQNNLRTSVSTTLDTANKLRDEALKMRQRSRMDSQMNSVTNQSQVAGKTKLDSLWNDDQKDSLKQNMKKLSEKILARFGKVSTAFRAFDMRIRGKVSFSDFAYVLDQLQLGFNRDTMLQIFTFMDYDKDTMLKY